MIDAKEQSDVQRWENHAVDRTFVSCRVFCGPFFPKAGSEDSLDAGAVLQFYFHVCGDYHLPGKDRGPFPGTEDVSVL